MGEGVFEISRHANAVAPCETAIRLAGRLYVSCMREIRLAFLEVFTVALNAI